MGNRIDTVVDLQFTMQTKIKESLIVIMTFFVIQLLYPIILFVLIGIEWSVILMSITIVTYILCGWITIYQLVARYFPSRKIIRFLSNAQSTSPSEFYGKITKISKEDYTINGVLCKELSLSNKDFVKICFIPSNHLFNSNYLNVLVKLEVHKMIVLSYEESVS